MIYFDTSVPGAIFFREPSARDLVIRLEGHPSRPNHPIQANLLRLGLTAFKAPMLMAVISFAFGFLVGLRKTTPRPAR